MKIRNSLKSLKSRHRDCRVIRRRGRTYVINKTNRRFKRGRAKLRGSFAPASSPAFTFISFHARGSLSGTPHWRARSFRHCKQVFRE